MLARSHAPLSAAIGTFGYHTYIGMYNHGLTFHQVITGEGVKAMTPQELMTSVLVAGVVAGFALVPDLDSPGATLAQKLWPIGPAFASVFGLIMGGHRKGSHSILAGIPLMALACYFAATWSPIALAVIFAVAFYVSSGLVFGNKGIVFTLAGMAGIGALTYYSGLSAYEGAAIAIAGMVLHVMEDMLTEGKVYFVWPIPLRFSLGLFQTGGAFENSIVCQGGIWLLLLASQILCVIYPAVVILPTLFK